MEKIKAMHNLIPIGYIDLDEAERLLKSSQKNYILFSSNFSDSNIHISYDPITQHFRLDAIILGARAPLKFFSSLKEAIDFAWDFPDVWNLANAKFFNPILYYWGEKDI